MSRQSHKPCPPPIFSSAYRSNLACGYLHLQRRPPHLIFCSTFFERPPAPVANASTSLPLLAAQADQALQPFFPEYYKLCGLQPKQAWSCLPPATCQRSKFSATKVLPTHRILPPPSKAPAIRRTTQPSPWLQYGAASLPAPPRLTPPSAAARLHPRLQGSNHLLQPPHMLHQQKNWTVAEIRQVLTSAGVIIPRRSSKSDLLALYNSLQSGEFLNSSPPLESATTASKSRKSPYSRPGPIFTPSRTGLRPPNRSSRPSASLGRAPDTAALSPHLPRASTERQLATQPSKESAFASTSRLTRTSTPPSAAYSYTQPRTTNPSPTMARSSATHASPTPSAQAPAPVLPPPPPPPLSVHQALSGSNLPQSSTQTPAIPPPLPRSQLRPRSPLFSFYHLASTHTSKRTSTGTTPRSQLHQVHQVTNPIRNSEHWHRRRIHSPPQYHPFSELIFP